MLYNLRVAAGDHDAGPFGSLSHRAYFRFEDIALQASFQNEGNNDCFRPRARDREIIHGTVDRKLANGAAGKSQRLDYKTIRCNGDSRSVYLDGCGIAQRALAT